jgi:hypothetical protein
MITTVRKAMNSEGDVASKKDVANKKDATGANDAASGNDAAGGKVAAGGKGTSSSSHESKEMDIDGEQKSDDLLISQLTGATGASANVQTITQTQVQPTNSQGVVTHQTLGLGIPKEVNPHVGALATHGGNEAIDLESASVTHATSTPATVTINRYSANAGKSIPKLKSTESKEIRRWMKEKDEWQTALILSNNGMAITFPIQQFIDIDLWDWMKRYLLLRRKRSPTRMLRSISHLVWKSTENLPASGWIKFYPKWCIIQGMTLQVHGSIISSRSLINS